MSSERLIYLPLGGAGEIGMNCYVYGYGKPDEERLIVVDLGVTFPDMDTTPGVDLIFPDISWLEARKDRIEAIFITHAHEDHVGAVGHLWEKLGAPIHARAFTANIARRKMDEHGYSEQSVRTVEPWPETVTAGPFTVGFVPISHSIPESSGLAIDTPAGRVVHTGDFKIDETPGVGEPFDRTLWAQVAEPGVKALVCDSTNVFSDHPGRSEASVGCRSAIRSPKALALPSTRPQGALCIPAISRSTRRRASGNPLTARFGRRWRNRASRRLSVTAPMSFPTIPAGPRPALAPRSRS